MDFSAKAFANQAMFGNYIGIPYSKLDCQAFVERVLKDLGVRDSTGVAYNWRGSNHMWREAVSNRKELAGHYDEVPVGAWLFRVLDDGGERKRGYKDDMKNACHVGIYVGDGKVMHSTTGGVQWGNLSNAGWTHYAEACCLNYLVDPNALRNKLDEAEETAKNLLAMVQAIREQYVKECF